MSNLVRDPNVVWRVEKKREAEMADALASGEVAADFGTVTLVAAGTMHQLNYVGGTIWQLCDGSRDIAAIADALAGEFDVPRAELEDDIRAFADDLIERGWLRYG